MTTSEKKGALAIICLSSGPGGMEIDSIKLATKLKPYMPVVIIAKKGSYIEAEVSDPSKDYKISLEVIDFSLTFSFSIIFGVRKILKKYNIKNVIFFGASELKSLFFSFFALDLNVIIRHGTVKRNSKKDILRKILYKNINCHVAICENLQENIREIIPFGEKTRLALIYSSVEPRKVSLEKSTCLTLLHVGRIAFGKGQMDAILACSILWDHQIDFMLYLVGELDEKYKEDFLAVYNSLPYKENIILAGFTENVESYLAKSDIFLFPSYGEGLSNAFLEALSHGLKCISYNNTSFPELLSLGFDFTIVEDRNIEKLKTALLLASQESPNIEFRNKNEELAKKYFSPEREIEKYLEILR